MRTILLRTACSAAIAAVVLSSVHATASAQSNPRDLMFAIDSTGSMNPYIDETKIAVDDLATDLASDAAGTRSGLVEYRDDGDSFQSRTVTPLTTDLDAFRTGLNGVTVGGGGDTPESVFSGIARALCEDWNDSATKAVIAIGDAVAKDPEPVTDLTAERIIALANGTATDNPYCSAAEARTAAAAATTGGVQIYVVSANSALIEQLARVAEATGGTAVAVENIEDLADAIKDTVGDIDEGDGGGIFGSLEDLLGSSGS